MRLFGVLFLLTLAIPARAQFNSGSTGADGPLDLSTMNCPSNICRVQLPESGVLNYTTINIPANKTLRFIPNSRNTPAHVLATSDVVLNGLIAMYPIADFTCGSSTSQELAPGGFRGGAVGRPGFGPGGGQQNNESGRWVGPLSLVPLVGGSGGAGTVLQFFQSKGGDGGGAILLASSSSITGSGGIDAQGSAHGNCSYGSSRGSGGAIRLVATTISFSGNFNACGLNCGVVRLEANSLTFTGTSSPLAVASPINPVTLPSSLPVLTLVSIGGYSVPEYAGTRFDLIDVLLPNQLTDPISVVVAGQNIPVGTQVQIGFVAGSPSGTSTPCSLAGSLASSACTATISNLARTGGTYLLATAAFEPASFMAKYNPKGRNQVAKIKLEAVVGAQPRYTFLRANGTVIDPKRISPRFLREFGM